VAALSEWLELMLAEIARKREELENAHAEQAQRELESSSGPGPTSDAACAAAEVVAEPAERAAPR
jgi:hypothetical protein